MRILWMTLGMRVDKLTTRDYYFTIKEYRFWTRVYELEMRV